MSLFRYAFGRLLGGLLALGLFALFLNALILSQHHISQSAVTVSGPPPAPVPLAAAALAAPEPEVAVLARIDAAIDVAVPGGTGKLFLLADPADARTAPARAAVYVSPRDFPAFEALLAETTVTTVDGAPVIPLNGTTTVPYWIDRAEAAASDAERSLAPDAVFIRPFLYGRAAGLAPSPLSYVVPALLFALVAGILLSELRRMVLHRRARLARAALDDLDRAVEDTAAIAIRLPPGDSQWADVTARRHDQRRKRVRLDAILARGGASGHHRWVWPVAIVAGGIASVVPRRPLFDALATHLVGADLRQAVPLPVRLAWADIDSLLVLPGDAMAKAVVALFGPQSLGVAAEIRSLPFSLWMSVLALVLLVSVRRADTRRSLRRSLD